MKVKNSLKRVLSIALCAMMLLSLVGCGQTEETPSNQEENTQVTYRDTICFAQQTITKVFDPTGSNQVDDTISQYYTHQTLLDMDAEGNVTGDLAESYEYDEATLTYTFHLKENAVFSDGTPVTAKDVVFSLNRAKESSFSSSRVVAIESMDAIDEHTVAIHLNQASLDILSSLAHSQMSIISEAAMEKDPENGYTLGSGRYTIKEYDPDNYIIYEAVENYYDGEVLTKHLKYMKIAEAASRAMALQSGDIDLDMYLDKSEAELIKSDPLTDVIEVPATNSFFMQLNPGSPRCPQLADQRVRQAIAYCINQEDIILGGQEGFGYVSELYPVVALDTSAYSPCRYETNVEKAKALMEEAGCADGFELDCSYLSKYTPVVEVLQAQLAQININLTTHSTDTTVRTTEQKEGTFSSNLLTFNNNYAPGTMAIKVFKSDGAAHYVKTEPDAAIDELAVKVNKETDIPTRQQLGAELEKLIADQACYLPLCGMIDLYGVNTALQGVYFNNNVVLLDKAFIVE